MIDQYFNIIENKKTDGYTLQEKKDAWQSVCDSFNSVTTNSIRTVEQIKTAYNNIKRKIKKNAADDKVRNYSIYMNL